MEHIKHIMEREGYIPLERPKYDPEWKPTWPGFIAEVSYDLIVFAGRCAVIFFLGSLAVNILAQTLVAFFIQKAPEICSMIAHGIPL